MRKKNYLLLPMFILCVTSLVSQSDYFTLYNQSIINPAALTLNNTSSVNMLLKNQFVNIGGAPFEGLVNYQTNIKTTNFSTGFSYKYDRIGSTKLHSLIGDASYKIKTSKKSSLSLGVKFGYHEFNISASNTSPYSGNYLSSGAGLYWRGKNSFVGLSVPNIYLSEDRFSSVRAPFGVNAFETIFTAGKKVELFNYVSLLPIFITRFQRDKPASIGGQINFMFYNKIMLGGGYRLNDIESITANLHVNLTPVVSVGYAYDYLTSDLGSYNTGVHQILVRLNVTGKSRNNFEGLF